MAHDIHANSTTSGGHPIGAQGEAAVDADGRPMHAPHDYGGGHAPSLKTYFIIFALLLLLLLVTVILAYQHVPEQGPMRELMTIVGYTIAIIKAVLIILFFMHVKGSSRLMWVFSMAAFFWLGLMILMMQADYTTRGNIPGTFRAERIIQSVPQAAQSHGTSDRPRSGNADDATH